MTAHNKYEANDPKLQGCTILRIIRFSELETLPWKNGGGITREIAALRLDENIMWRLSMADVESNGPFSNFAGLTRILTVIKGNGIKLISADQAIHALFGVPVEFDGALNIQSQLINGPVRDLNVMFDPKICAAKVLFAKTSMIVESVIMDEPQTIAIIGLRGTARVNSEHNLQFGDTALSHNGRIDLLLENQALALVVKLEMRGSSIV